MGHLWGRTVSDSLRNLVLRYGNGKVAARWDTEAIEELAAECGFVVCRVDKEAYWGREYEFPPEECPYLVEHAVSQNDVE